MSPITRIRPSGKDLCEDYQRGPPYREKPAKPFNGASPVRLAINTFLFFLLTPSSYLSCSVATWKPRHVDDVERCHRRTSGATCDVSQIHGNSLANLGLDAVLGKRRGDETGRITAKYAALGAFA